MKLLLQLCDQQQQWGLGSSSPVLCYLETTAGLSLTKSRVCMSGSEWCKGWTEVDTFVAVSYMVLVAALVDSSM